MKTPSDLRSEAALLNSDADALESSSLRDWSPDRQLEDSQMRGAIEVA